MSTRRRRPILRRGRFGPRPTDPMAGARRRVATPRHGHHTGRNAVAQRRPNGGMTGRSAAPAADRAPGGSPAIDPGTAAVPANRRPRRPNRHGGIRPRAARPGAAGSTPTPRGPAPPGRSPAARTAGVPGRSSTRRIRTSSPRRTPSVGSAARPRVQGLVGGRAADRPVRRLYVRTRGEMGEIVPTIGGRMIGATRGRA